MLESRNVITYGLTQEENGWVLQALPNKGYRVLDTDAPTDLIAVDCAASIIDASRLDADSIQMLWDYYGELGGCFSETVLWLGTPLPPTALCRYICCYESFEALQDRLRYVLLEAHRKNRKTAAFSTSLMYALQILTTIRNRPGVTTKQLSGRCEISERSVLRYIETLRCCGEGIEYDPKRKGWQLFHGVSFLLGEHMPEELER